MTDIIVTFLGSLYLLAIVVSIVFVLSVFGVYALMNQSLSDEKTSFLATLNRAYYSERIIVLRCLFIMIGASIFSYFIIGINVFNVVSIWNYSNTPEWAAVSEMGFSGFFVALKNISISEMFTGISELSISNFILITVSLLIAFWLLKVSLFVGNRAPRYAVYKKSMNYSAAELRNSTGRMRTVKG